MNLIPSTQSSTDLQLVALLKTYESQQAPFRFVDVDVDVDVAVDVDVDVGPLDVFFSPPPRNRHQRPVRRSGPA